MPRAGAAKIAPRYADDIVRVNWEKVRCFRWSA